MDMNVQKTTLKNYKSFLQNHNTTSCKKLVQTIYMLCYTTM